MPDMPNPWKTIGSDIKYQNEWIGLREDKVIEPDGKEALFPIVLFKSGVSVLPVDDDGVVYLVKQHRYAVERTTLEVVSGGLHLDEALIDGARRELREEVGLTAHEYTPLGFVNPFTNVAKCTNHLYLARGLVQGDHERDLTELIEIVKVPYHQALEWVMDSTITHSPSVATILKARDHLL